MTWYDAKQAAVDPDNPAANEQIPFSEWNNMVTYLKDKIINKTVNAAAIGDDKILVYDLVSDTFVFESRSTVAVINDLTDVTISGVPADNEVLAYNSGTADWVNQTAAEAGLATVAELTAYLPLAGGTMTGDLNMANQRLDDVNDLQAYDSSGVVFRDSGGLIGFQVSAGGYAFAAYYDGNMSSHKLINVTDPTAAQDASTKNYDDTHLFEKEAVTSFLDGYIPVYRTASGKFEMEGLAPYLPLAGGTMTGDLNMGDYLLEGVGDIQAYDTDGIRFLTSAGLTRIDIASMTYSFEAHADASMNSHTIHGLADPTSNDHASNKGYDDTHLFTKEVVTSFIDGYIPVYNATSGKFEMEEQSAALGLPVVDTTVIVKGTADGTKLMRFEVGGLSTGVTREMTIPNKDITLCDTAEAMLLSGAQAMTGDLNLDSHNIDNCFTISAAGSASQLTLAGGASTSASIGIYGNSYYAPVYRGDLRIFVPNAAGSLLLPTVVINGLTDTPTMELMCDIDMAANDIDDIGALILNNATELTITSGAVTATQSYHTIDTEGGATTDDLDSISGGSAGMIITLRAESGARTVVCKSGTGNLQLEGDMSLDNAFDTLSLIYNGIHWLETSRSNNGA